MARLYLAAAIVIGGASAARAQPQPSSAQPDRPPLGSSITVDALAELPASATVFALLDTAIPDVIADRIDTGGLSAGEPARIGAHGSSWTQTLYRIGDVDITDPGGSGVPLLTPGVVEWERVDVATGLMPIDLNAPGLAVTLSPQRAGKTWSRLLNVFASPPFLNAAGAATTPVSIARLNSWAHGNFTAGGPLAGDTVSGFGSMTWTRSAHFQRAVDHTLDANLASAFVNLFITPGGSNQLRLIGWGQRTREPFANQAALQRPTAAERDTALHTQASWERQLSDAAASVRAFGSVTIRRRHVELESTPFATIERLREGPVPALVDPGAGDDRIWTAGGRAYASKEDWLGDRHAFVSGLDLSGSSMTMQAAFTGTVGELVNGLPARAWVFTDPASISDWRGLTIAAFASDTAALTSWLTVNAGARFEMTRGYASPTADAPAISWRNWYPRAGMHAAITDFWRIAAFAQFARYGHRLPLRDLAYGDPTAPTGSVYRWNGGNLALPGSLGPLVQRVGPGSGGNPSFSAIDPALRRPYMDEVTFGFESRPHSAAFARMVAIARREKPLVGVVNVGVPSSTYSTIGVPDTGIDRVGDKDDQILLFYNRAPSTFGADRYLLTNAPDHVATFVGVDIMGQVHARRLFVIAGATAGRSEGLSAYRGFGPLENDAASLGDQFADPNSNWHAQGRLFTERGYTIKTALAYQFGGDFTASVVGRYQDGQHFARMVIMPNLNQGPEAIRAFRNGRTRFMFSATGDLRLQKRFTIGRYHLTTILDAYNFLNLALDVEEFQVTGAGARIPSAVQPPRVLHIGLRLPF